jgi:hypothetical protein
MSPELAVGERLNPDDIDRLRINDTDEYRSRKLAHKAFISD